MLDYPVKIKITFNNKTDAPLRLITEPFASECTLKPHTEYDIVALCHKVPTEQLLEIDLETDRMIVYSGRERPNIVVFEDGELILE